MCVCVCVCVRACVCVCVCVHIHTYRVSGWRHEAALEDAELAAAFGGGAALALVFEIDVPLEAVLRARDLDASGCIAVGCLPRALRVLASFVFDIHIVGASVRRPADAPTPLAARLR